LSADERNFANRDQSAEDKEKKKAEKMAVMMAQYDTVCDTTVLQPWRLTFVMIQGSMSERDEQLRSMVSKLDAIDAEEGVASLTLEDVQYVRRQLVDGQNVMQDAIDRLRQVQEENEMISRRRDELEQRLATVEADYEDLFGKLSTRYNRLTDPANFCICTIFGHRKDNSCGGKQQHEYRGFNDRTEGLSHLPHLGWTILTHLDQ
jgi:chromosome segregation ATPase